MYVPKNLNSFGCLIINICILKKENSELYRPFIKIKVLFKYSTLIKGMI